MTRPPQRLAPPEPSTYTPRQREIHDQITSGPRGGVRGPLAVWLHRPELAARAQDLGRYCRYESSLDQRLSELAILVTGRIFGSDYEWQIHKGHALEAGLESEVIEAIRCNHRPVFPDTETELVHDIARATLQVRDLDDNLYVRAQAVLGDQRLVDLVALLGYYTLISITINIFRIPPVDGGESEFSDG
jgi:4-carboxymuconolactone decarboxylase